MFDQTCTDILYQYFGYRAFRGGQEDIIYNIVNHKDTMAIMPTGAGKSICFQVPALSFSGITLVVSPLISLMKDQVTALIEVGVKAAYINSSLTMNQTKKALQNAKEGMYKIIYVAPERLLTESFLDFALNSHISFIAIDEAHCVSQWGQDFRPGYLKVAEFVEKLEERPVLAAFTATATPIVKEEICELLGLRSPFILQTGFNRENLRFVVEKPYDKLTRLKEYMEQYQNKSGIIYCNTRKNVEMVYEFLLDQGYQVGRYHAGMDNEERKLVQEAFIYDRYQVMVATNAFGMGIDKSNVSYVIHFNMPQNIENYYQEAGRAGRDGEPADCILLYSGQDVYTNRFLIDNTNQNEEIDEETAKIIRNRNLIKLNKMIDYCNSSKCLRKFILGYFGETLEKNCGNCSYCSGDFKPELNNIQITIINCVESVDGRFGMSTICDILLGNDTERTEKYRLDESIYFGVLSEYTVKRLYAMIYQMIDDGYLEVSDKQYPVLSITSVSKHTLVQKRAQIKKKAVVKAFEERTSYNQTLYKQLVELRFTIAKKQGVPAYVVFTDATLKELCKVMPKTLNEMRSISGIGDTKLNKYGQEFLNMILNFKK